MRFNGPGPELINGRLAMLGFLLAARNEFQTGETVLQQSMHVPWPWLLLLAVVVYASLVPMLKGARHEAFGELAHSSVILCMVMLVVPEWCSDQSNQLCIHDHLTSMRWQSVCCACTLFCSTFMCLINAQLSNRQDQIWSNWLHGSCEQTTELSHLLCLAAQAACLTSQLLLLQVFSPHEQRSPMVEPLCWVLQSFYC